VVLRQLFPPTGRALHFQLRITPTVGGCAGTPFSPRPTRSCSGGQRSPLNHDDGPGALLPDPPDHPLCCCPTAVRPAARLHSWTGGPRAASPSDYDPASSAGAGLAVVASPLEFRWPTGAEPAAKPGTAAWPPAWGRCSGLPASTSHQAISTHKAPPCR